MNILLCVVIVPLLCTACSFLDCVSMRKKCRSTGRKTVWHRKLSACPAARPVGNCFMKRQFHPPLLARRGVLCTGWRISFMADVCSHCCQVQQEFFFGGITFNERTDVVESHRLPYSRWYKFLPLLEAWRFEAWAERRLSAHSRTISVCSFQPRKSGVHLV